MTAHLPAACQVKTPSSGQRASARRRRLRHKPEQRHTTLSSFVACRDSTAARSHDGYTCGLILYWHEFLGSSCEISFGERASTQTDIRGGQAAYCYTPVAVKNPVTASSRASPRLQDAYSRVLYYRSSGMTARIDTSYHYTKALRFLLLIHFFLLSDCTVTGLSLCPSDFPLDYRIE